MNPEMIKWLALAMGIIFGIKFIAYFILGIRYEGSKLQFKDSCQGMTRKYPISVPFLITVISAIVWWFV